MKNYVVEQVFVDPSKIIGPPEEAILPFPPDEAKERIRKLDAIVMFEKGLTQSDTSGAGRIVIPKAVAESHFPHLEDTKGIVISLIDVFGVTRGLKFRFWVNNNSRMYIVEGTQRLLRTFKLGVGDVLMFAKDTEGQIFVCGRKGTKDDMFRKPPSFTRKTKRREETQGKGKTVAMDSKRFHAETQKLPGNTPDPSQVVTGRTRQLSNDELEISGSYTYWNGLSFPPRSDGVFRAVPITRVREPDQVSVQYGMWCVTVTLAGEQYQAFFDSREAASAALHCAEQSIL